MKQIVDFEQAQMLWNRGIIISSDKVYRNNILLTKDIVEPEGEIYAPTIGELIEWIRDNSDDWDVDIMEAVQNSCFESTELIDALVKLTIKIRESR